MNLYREAFSHIKNFPAAFWVVIAATFINQAGNMAFVFLVIYMTQHLGFSLTQGATAFAVFSGSMLISGILIGNVIDRVGAMRVMIVSVVANGITLIIFPLIHQYYLILFACVMWGIFYGAYRPAAPTFISHLSAAGMHKITFSLYRLALNLGMSIGPAIAGYLTAYSYAGIYITNGVANLLVSLILVIGLGSMCLKYQPEAQSKKVFSLKWLKYDSTLRLFVIGMIPVSMIFFQHESTLPVYLKQNLGLPLSFYGWLFTINTLMIVFFELLLNIATINWSYRVHFILGTLFIAAGFTGFIFATSMWHVVILTMIWTLGEMILYPSASSYIADIAPAEHRGSYMSMYGTCTNAGMLLGPWAVLLSCNTLAVLLYGLLVQ